MKYLLHLSYKGTRYRGWQRQRAGIVTVQETIEKAIQQVLGYHLHVHGCGRTDAQVHSSNYVAHIKPEVRLREDFLYIINKTLPADIVIHKIIPVADGSHAQFHAVDRRYDYYLHTVSDPMLDDLSTLYEGGLLDFEIMNEALSLIVGTHDFKGYCKQVEKHDSTDCIIKTAQLYQEGNRLQIRIHGNRFLRSMVRLLVGNLMLVGSYELNINKWKEVLDGADVYEDFNIAPPTGLYLSGIGYAGHRFYGESFLSLAASSQTDL